MHELSVAMSIVKIAEEKAIEKNAPNIESVTLEIGELSGIQIESLNFVWPAAVENTLLEKAEKKINIIQSKARCAECGNYFKINHLYDNCPRCNSPFKDIYQGKEMNIKHIIIPDKNKR